MEFDFVTWSIWTVGFVIWVIWTYFSVEELRTIVDVSRKERERGEASVEQIDEERE